MLMLALVLSAANLPVDASVATRNQPEIVLSERYGRALILGLEREIGGKFVITGLAGAQALCGKLGSCISGAALSRQLPSTSVTSYNGLLQLARVDGRQPEAIVSLRTTRAVPGGSIELFASVYDANSRSWRDKKGVLKEIYYGSNESSTSAATTARLQSWSDVL